MRKHNTLSSPPVFLNSSFHEKTLTCELSLVAFCSSYYVFPQSRCACMQAGRSLHCLDCVQPCLLFPLSRHSQEVSSQYQAGTHSDALPHTLHVRTHTWEHTHTDAAVVSQWALVVRIFGKSGKLLLWREKRQRSEPVDVSFYTFSSVKRPFNVFHLLLSRAGQWPLQQL